MDLPAYVSYAKLAERSRGRRVYLQNKRLLKLGFAPGSPYSATFEKHRIVLVAGPGNRRVCGRDGRTGPISVIDIEGPQVRDSFKGVDRVRVIYRQGVVEIDLHPIEKMILEREERIRSGMVTTGSVCTGIGVMDHALHSGLKAAGVTCVTRFGLDINEEYIGTGIENNPVLRGAMVVTGSLDEIEPELLPKVELLAAGLPCTAASISGRSKKGLAKPEDDEHAGHLIVPFIEVIKRTNPAILVFENVVPYASSASMSILRTCLDRFGYRLFETTIEGADFSLEARNRVCLVAISKGVAPDGFEVKAVRKHHAISEIQEDVPLDSPRWKTAEYLATKEERDMAAGKGFRTQIVTKETSQVGTIGRGYSKWRSTEPRLAHPEDRMLTRLFTPREHARIKGIPESLIKGLPDTTAHEVLGQSIVYGTFEAVGKEIGRIITALRDAVEEREDLVLVA